MQLYREAEWKYMTQSFNSKTWERFPFGVYLLSVCEHVLSIVYFFVAFLAPSPRLFLRTDIWVSHVAFTQSHLCFDLWYSRRWNFLLEISSPAQLSSIISLIIWWFNFPKQRLPHSYEVFIFFSFHCQWLHVKLYFAADFFYYKA